VTKGRYRKLAHRMAMVFCGLAVAIWMSAMAFSSHYDGTRPSHPDYGTGRLYALNNHSHVVYLTRDEDRLLTGLMFLPFCLFFTGFMVDRLFGEPPQLLKSKVPWENRQW
jgi:hypothetical protein